MKTLKNIQLLVLLLAALFFSLGAVEQTRSEESQLQFTISNEPERWVDSWRQPMQIAKPTHVAVFQLQNLRTWTSPWVRIIARVKGRLKRSEKEFDHVILERVTITGEDAATKPYEFLLSRDRAGENRIQFWLYAASEKEARKMARAMIEGAKSLADVYVRRAEADLELRRKRIADANNEIPKIEEQKKSAEAQFAECKKTTYYRNADDAHESILEWNNLLSSAEVDIIGIQAKIDTINRLEKEYYHKEPFVGLIESLGTMKVAEEIELAGALARKNAADSHRKKALKFLDLAIRCDDLSIQIDKMRMQLSNDQNAIAKQERRLPQLRAEAVPIEVLNNEVKIHPVE